MSIFKIKIKAIVKEREYEINHVGAGRKDKVCEICGNLIPAGHPSTTFTKRVSVGERQTYETHHACSIKRNMECAQKLVKKLKIDPNEIPF